MKTLVIALAFLVPSLTLAAPLTTQQATSLINVVQSSPGTPASAFTDLITTFSNITVSQANSLITVVQAAPGVPATSFVNMLIAFTVDPVIPKTTPTPTPTPIQPQPNTPPLGSTPVDNATTTATTTVQSVPVSPYPLKLGINEIVSRKYGQEYPKILRISSNEALDFTKTILPVGVTLGSVIENDADVNLNATVFKASKEGGPTHFYALPVDGVTTGQYLDVTFTGVDGKTITKTFLVN
jgi:hypothetical protein